MFSLCSRVFTMFAYIVAKCKFQYICVYTYIYTYIHIYTLDVKSLYTSTSNPEGMAAVKNAHERYQHKTGPTKVITTFLASILTLNNFIFNSKFYLQIIGCAMDTICAPPYANISMA